MLFAIEGSKEFEEIKPIAELWGREGFDPQMTQTSQIEKGSFVCEICVICG